jgi:hypothetical protein
MLLTLKCLDPYHPTFNHAEQDFYDAALVISRKGRFLRQWYYPKNHPFAIKGFLHNPADPYGGANFMRLAAGDYPKHKNSALF